MSSSTPLPQRPRTEGGPRVRSGRLAKIESTRGSSARSVGGASVHSGSTDGAMSADIERIQVQTGVFQKKTRIIKSEIRGLEDEIGYYKGEIDKYRKTMGGLTALPLNDMYVQQEIAIMEKRLVKAKTHYMNCIEHNRALRERVDEVRRERIIQQDVAQRLRSDVEAVRQDTEEVEARIAATKKQTAKVVEQTEDFRARAMEVLAAKEAEFHELDDGNPEGFVIPTTPPALDSPRGDPPSSFKPRNAEDDDLPTVDEEFFETLSTHLGNLTAHQEARLRERVGSAMWDSIIVTIQEQQMSERVTMYEEVFEEIKRTLGVDDLDGFNDLFAYREEQNYAILCSINDLNEETTRIEEQINRATSARKALIEAAATENVERRKSSDALSARLRECESRLEWYREKLDNLQLAATAFKTGVGRIYGGLNGLTKDEEVPGLTETNMIRFLAVVEQQVFQLFKMFLQQKASPSKRLHGGTLSRSGSSRKLAASASMEEDMLRMKQGPSVKAHTLRKTLTSAHVDPPEVAAITAGATAAGDDKDDEDASGVARPLKLEAIRKLTMSLHSTQSLVSPVTPAAKAGKSRGGERRPRRVGRKSSTRT